MDKKEFKQTIEQIDVPKEKVFGAIEEGLRYAGVSKTQSLKKKLYLASVLLLH